MSKYSSYESPYKPLGSKTASSYYDPANLFSSNLSQIAPEFASRRYRESYNGNQIRNDTSVGRNLATGRIYDVNNPQFSTEPYSAFSSGQSASTNLAHGEPAVILESLRRMYEQDKPPLHQNPNPFMKVRSKKPTEVGPESVQALMNTASKQKEYMTTGGRNRNLELLSELPFCSKYDSNCSNLYRNIAPFGSKGGHTVNGWDPNDYRVPIENAVNRLGPAYQEYLNNKLYESPMESMSEEFLPVVEEYQNTSKNPLINSISQLSSPISLSKNEITALTQSPVVKEYNSPKNLSPFRDLSPELQDRLKNAEKEFNERFNRSDWKGAEQWYPGQVSLDLKKEKKIKKIIESYNKEKEGDVEPNYFPSTNTPNYSISSHSSSSSESPFPPRILERLGNAQYSITPKKLSFVTPFKT